MIPHVFHPQAHLFHDLPAGGLLHGFPNLGKPGNQGVLRHHGPVGIADQQQPLPVSHGHHHRRVDAGIDQRAAIGAAHGPLLVVPYRGRAAAAAEAIGSVPVCKVQRRCPHEAEKRRLHTAKRRRGRRRQPGANTLGRLLQQVKAPVVHGEEIDQLLLLRAQRQHLRHRGKAALPRQQYSPFVKQHRRIAAVRRRGRNLKLIVKAVGRDILKHENTLLS
ncbi:hypothetical protein SDC9_93344 [bioreactor metagenome]|uniref:Uncharacterized protein n=1 Tax=bioreactor metagenome TaxID=1076179 RepID=A0A645A0B5_9ZZZZ